MQSPTLQFKFNQDVFESRRYHLAETQSKMKYTDSQCENQAFQADNNEANSTDKTTISNGESNCVHDNQSFETVL